MSVKKRAQVRFAPTGNQSPAGGQSRTFQNVIHGVLFEAIEIKNLPGAPREISTVGLNAKTFRIVTVGVDMKAIVELRQIKFC